MSPLLVTLLAAWITSPASALFTPNGGGYPSTPAGAPHLPTTPEGHCQVAKGDWCLQYYQQAPLPSKPLPRGDLDCPSGCSGVGSCNHDSGVCYCPAGFGGPDCSLPRKRPCFRMGPDKRDEGWHHPEWTHTRCAGVCDDDLAMCYCPPETKYGHIPAPAGSPLGAPPIRAGRPLFLCQPKTDAENKTVTWGQLTYEELLGPSGWCNTELPSFHCPCRLDGLVGERCQINVEHFCVNQCSGHGVCHLGFCKCHDGWYGNDCSRKRKGQVMEPGDEVTLKPWLQQAMRPVSSAQVPPASPTRKRPLIYVYDTPPAYHTDIMQYRIEKMHCTYRTFGLANESQFVGYNAYAVESVLMELFATTEHRTFDPEEADFFFVPTAVGCLFDVYGWNKIPMWPPGFHGVRPFGAANMLREVYKWVSQTHPWFNRTQGRNHIWVTPHDEGACAAPKEIWPGIMLSHWGRMDFPHRSNTQYGADNYTQEHIHPTFPEGWLAWTSNAHPCFDPVKDLVIPCFKYPLHYDRSQYVGAKVPRRDILLFFRGDVGRTRVDPKCLYSRCIRQTIDRLVREGGWREKHAVWYGDTSDTPGAYGELLKRSRYCLALPGDGWSARFEDAILHGCIPVIIMDNTQVPFESVLDMASFTLRVLEKDIPRLVEILKAVPPEREAEMRQTVDKVWQRFRWTGVRLVDSKATSVFNARLQENGGALSLQEGSQYAAPSGLGVDDAFATVMQWLFSRIPHTRGAQQQP